MSLNPKKSLHRDPRPLSERRIIDNPIKGTKSSRSVTVNLAESPLSWLHIHGHLNERQFLAGEKLRGDYEAAQLGPRVTMTWDAMPVNKSRRSAPRFVEAGEHSLYAKDRFDQAITALGQDLSDIAWRVICAGEGMSVAEKSMGWPTRSGKLVLRIALDRLADHYRVPL